MSQSFHFSLIHMFRGEPSEREDFLENRISGEAVVKLGRAFIISKALFNFSMPYTCYQLTNEMEN